MKNLSQLGFLKLPFERERPVHEDGRVLALFRNRAELKKSFGELQDEVYRLKDRIKQQEGATSRVQDMLEALETRLGSGDGAYPALVFYQLRALWQVGRQLLTQLGKDLARQQDERERRAHLAEHNRRTFTKREELTAAVRGAEAGAAAARERLSALQSSRVQLNRLWHYFKRRELERRLQPARLEVSNADIAFGAARIELEQLDKETPPEFPGLSTESRRAINLALIAYAEILCLRLAKSPLIQLAKDAATHREVRDEYGTKEECETLIGAIAKAHAQFQLRCSPVELKERVERLRLTARYRHLQDTTPTPESLNLAAAQDAAQPPNVLAEDIFDLFRVMLR